MNRTSQWLFEAPFILESDRYTDPYTNPEYYSNSEWGSEWETPVQKPCKQIWTVWGFKPNSSTLLAFQKKHIKDIAKRLHGLFKRDLKGKSENAYIEIQLSFEGHVDKKTDSANYGKLDLDRAGEVSFELDNQLGELSTIDFFSQLKKFDYSPAGSTRPYDSNSPQKNRRVVVCVRWEIKT
jgi:hypothetical protein